MYNQDLATCFGVDNAMAALLRSGYSIEKDGLLLTQEGVFGPSRKGIKVVYSTDTLPCQSLANQLTNADLAILEGMYWNTTPKNSKMYHSTCTESLQLAKARGVKEVWLTHFSPMFCNTGEAQQELREEYGDTITLGYSGLNRTLWFND
ncbi:MBL fold metallo-hydrolase [Acetivibrio ethanolgignens]|uniref:Metallo-beta-lactamase domain-containing protein n=1 Tax=Acetivibrio ethanolgignens TaxID=290052 RepID=A0A0V8QBD9_9FIRM|nr:MBL fold metallo-hydrolase [Acetivibrio ethanolgignens]KSV57899.1 hypothetical protein ASU35_14905 [Acetivibrio ethanolgignens]